MDITMKGLTTKLSCSLRMAKEFRVNGRACNAWHVASDEVLEFRYTDNRRIDAIRLSDIVDIRRTEKYSDDVITADHAAAEAEKE